MTRFFIIHVYNAHENGSPYCGPTLPPEPMNLSIWFCSLSECFYVNLNFSGSVVLIWTFLAQWFLRRFLYVNTCTMYCTVFFCCCNPTIPLASFCSTSGSFHVWTLLVHWFFRRIFFYMSETNFLFFWLSPFKEDMILYLDTLEFPSPKQDLYQVKLAWRFWRRFSVYCLSVKGQWLG
jgi:hypothetical protein